MDQLHPLVYNEKNRDRGRANDGICERSNTIPSSQEYQSLRKMENQRLSCTAARVQPERDFRMRIEFLLNPGSIKSGQISVLHQTEELSGAKAVKVHQQKQLWTKEDDAKLEEIVAKNGARAWEKLAQYFPGRSAGQLRSHWKYGLELKESKRPYTKEEDAFILTECARIGTSWTRIARKMYQRSDLGVKNRYKHLTRRFRRIQYASAPSRPQSGASKSISSLRV
uniref:Uncharacterized protein n=1 Tax=Timspurckia oligopyrenoides TaxID=708627 RepID=A0A7S0ZLM4_9RHOD|mmetsp:Transcript_9969/g.17955  ORF Transcript_9969/g.17955 Transcript_9969/m.17955 type:complete len:225 (+) Transcript_9969:83-757(+)